VLHRWSLPRRSSREPAHFRYFNVELGTPAFRWWRWEIGAERAEEQSEQPLSVEAAHYAVAGKVYVGNPTADWSKTTIVELVSTGGLRDGLTVPGTPGGIVKVR
jgi:hypothetical protein